MNAREFIPRSVMPTFRWTNQSVRAPFRQVRFAVARLKRNIDPKVHGGDRACNPAVVQKLEQDGFAMLSGVFDIEGLARLCSDIDAAVAGGLVYPIDRNPRTSNMVATLTDAEVALGEQPVDEVGTGRKRPVLIL